MLTGSNDKIHLKVNKGITTALGVTMCKEGINFAVAVEEDKSCSLLIYSYGCEEALATIHLKNEDKKGNIHSLLIKNLPQGRYEYIYKIDGEHYLDPYSRRITGRDAWGQEVEETKIRGAFNFEPYEWENDKPLEIPYEDIIMYSLHVRGFTKHSSSKVKNKGTFEGIVEKIPYLKELGINQIELMPAYEFDEIIPINNNIMEYKRYDKNKQYALNYWGYTKANYFAPKSSYSQGEDPVVSFKNMVKELHRNKIEVIMEFYFPENVNQNLIIDCIKFWVEEYHIDGVHLNSNNTPLDVIATAPMLSHVKIMSEGFALNRIYYGDKIPKYKNLAEYNEGFLIDARRFLKGDEEQLNHIAYRIRRNPNQCGMINYITNHNGFSLMDLVSYDMKHNEANGENNKDGNNYNFSWNCGVEGPTRKKTVLELRNQQIKNALVLLILSQGVPNLLSGDEIGNTQKGNNNSYCQDNDISWIDWSGEKKHKDILEFTKMLIQFRKKHIILHNKKELKIMDYLSCGYPDLSYHGAKAWYPEFENYNRQIGLMYCGKYAKNANDKEDDFIYVAYNMHWIEHEFALPNLPKDKKWRVVIDSSKNEVDSQIKIQKNIKINGRSIVVLVGK